MTHSNLTNHYLELLQYFQVYGTMLDVGCCTLQYLFQFDKSKFRRLIGIDINIPKDPFECYIDTTCPDLSSIDYDNLEKKFWRRYKFIEKDILDFHIDKGRYGFIFCKHVLHFIPHISQLQLIENFYYGLKLKGLLYLKINHNQNKQYSDHKKVDRIAKNCFKERRSNKIHYLSHPDDMIKLLSEKYHPEILNSDYKSVTALIRK